MRSRKTGLLALWLLTAACAARKPQTYRLVPQGRTRVLVPPGVAGAAIAQAVFAVEAPRWRPACAPSTGALQVQPRGRKIRVTVSRDILLAQPPGWLSQWTADTEAQGCLGPGAGLALALQIVESVPIDPSAAFRLLHADNLREGFLDLGPEDRLQVISPIMKDGASPDAPILATENVSATGNGNSLTLDLHTTDNLRGVETAWYAFQARPGGGAVIVPIAAQRAIAGKSEPAAAPITNYFQFAPQIAYYRLFYKTDPADNGITEIVVGAPTRAELAQRTRLLLADSSLCRTSDPQLCMVIPRRVGVNPFLVVTVNRKEVRLAIGSTVRLAILAGGGPTRWDEVLPGLELWKPFGGKLAAVEFDRTKDQVLDLVLLGGESLSWQAPAPR